MDVKNFHPISHTLILLTISGSFFPCIGSNNASFDSLVYKKCANQTYKGSIEAYSQTLSSILQELSSQSSNSKFFKTNKGNDTLGISALFQCRGDLNNAECYNCVQKLGETSSTSCDHPALAARIQLSGCYFSYEMDEFTPNDEDRGTTKHNVIQQTCDGNTAVSDGFVGVRDAALVALENGVAENGSNGFYEANYEYVHVMGQCEAGLEACDCEECIGFAVQVVQGECGSSVSGQVYLDECFVSYKYDPDAIPGNSYPVVEQGSADSRGKTVAIVVGGAAALFAGYIFLRYIRSRAKKDHIRVQEQ